MYRQFILTYNEGEADEEELTLTINPDGWDENGQSWYRDMIYHGVMQSYTVNTYRFLRKDNAGGNFIKEKYDLDDLKTNIKVVVKTRNPQTDGYDTTFTGKLNFNKDQLVIEKDFIDIGFVQGSHIQDFTNNEQVEINYFDDEDLKGEAITVFTNEYVSITFKPIDIYLKLVGMLTGFNITPVGYFLLNDSGGDESITLGFYEGEETDITTNEWGERYKLESDYIYANRSNTIYENDLEESVLLTINSTSIPSEGDNLRHSGTGSYSSRFRVYAIVRNSSGLSTITRVLYEKEWTDVFENYVKFDFIEQVYDNEFTVPAGGYLELVMRHEKVGVFSSATSEVSGRFDLNVDITEKTDGELDTVSACVLPDEAFTRLTQSMLGSDTAFYCELFGRTDSDMQTYTSDGSYAYEAIFNGMMVRKYPSTPLYLSFRNLFKSFDAIFNLGLSYDIENERFYIDEKDQFYKKNLLIADLEEVSSFTIKPYRNAYFNKIECGYDADGDYNDYGGANEVNLKSEFSIYQPVKDTLNIRSPYRADSIAIELTRRQQYRRTKSIDSDFDDAVFIIDTEDDETVQGATSATGFEGVDQYYNLNKTPRENLLRWSNFIRSQNWKEDTFSIRFRKSEKDTNISYVNQNSDTVYEQDHITSEEISEIIRLLNPQYYEFDGIFNETIRSSLEEDPHGVIQFSFDGTYYEGFVDKIETMDYKRQAKYGLIATDASRGFIKEFEDSKDKLFEDNYLNEID